MQGTDAYPLEEKGLQLAGLRKGIWGLVERYLADRKRLMNLHLHAVKLASVGPEERVAFSELFAICMSCQRAQPGIFSKSCPRRLKACDTRKVHRL